MRSAKIFGTLFFVASFALLSVLAISVHAQEAPIPAPSIDETNLKSFARAYVQIEKIRDTYVPQLQQTQDPQKGMEIQNEAKNKIDEALAKEGMTAESYSQTAQLVSADNTLRSKVIEFIMQERQKS